MVLLSNSLFHLPKHFEPLSDQERESIRKPEAPGFTSGIYTYMLGRISRRVRALLAPRIHFVEWRARGPVECMWNLSDLQI
jgi:hypothetical protein